MRRTRKLLALMIITILSITLIGCTNTKTADANNTSEATATLETVDNHSYHLGQTADKSETESVVETVANNTFAAEATTSATLDFCKKNVWNSHKMAKAAAVKSTGIKTFLATTVGKATVGVASAFVIGGVAIGTIAYSNNNNPPKDGSDPFFDYEKKI